MVPNLIMFSSMGLSALATAGSAKSIFLPPPNPFMAPVFFVFAALFIVLALVIWANKRTFDDISREPNPFVRIRLIKDVFDAIFSLLRLMPRASKDRERPTGGLNVAST
jgi:hypothetical protein